LHILQGQSLKIQVYNAINDHFSFILNQPLSRQEKSSDNMHRKILKGTITTGFLTKHNNYLL
ncbi:MAG: hypothetical protein ACYSR9_08455, partial [Planctomycetota bacterium]